MCEKRCSEHCLHKRTCDHIDGTCISGCQVGFTGNLCINSCKEGYYGRNCSSTCSTHCKSCNSSNGKCSCYAGWMGPNCSIEDASTTSGLSRVSSGILGATVSAGVFITTGVVILIIWRKKCCFPCRPSISNKESPYSEIENQPNGASTYQELTVPETNNHYENLSLN